MTSADIITSASDRIVLHTLNCGGSFTYPGTGNVEISFPVKSRPKIIGDIMTRPYLADEILTCKYDPRINGINLTPKWKSLLAQPDGKVIDPTQPVTQIVGDVACKDCFYRRFDIFGPTAERYRRFSR